MSSFTLKMIALVLMFVDHIGLFITNTPLCLRLIGRLSAPIFIFCSIWAFEYTSNRKRYLLRLYIAGIIMSIIQYYLHIDNNFFRTIFAISIILYLLDMKKNQNKYFGIYIRIYLIWQILSIVLNILLLRTALSDELVLYVIPALFGNIFELEGGLVFVFLGIILYLNKENKRMLLFSFITFDFVYLLLTVTSIIPRVLGTIGGSWGLGKIPNFIEALLVIMGLSPFDVGGSMWTGNFQWMMIFSLPFMLSYNYNKGRSMKWFFYIFYPTHIIILFYLGDYF